MADYHAVLQRTLSGFSDPKQQLRVKLYERARTTIRRQLEGRTPPVTGAALDGEMEKLELAIARIENSYDPSHPIPGESETDPADDFTETGAEIQQPVADHNLPMPEEAVKTDNYREQDDQAADEWPVEAAQQEAAVHEADPYQDDAVTANYIVGETEHAVEPDSGHRSYYNPDPAFETEAQAGETVVAPQSSFEKDSFEAAYENEFADSQFETEAPVAAQQPEPAQDDSILDALGQALGVSPDTAQQPAAEEPVRYQTDQTVDPIDQWASEFLAGQPQQAVAPEAVYHPASIPVPPAAPSQPVLHVEPDPYQQPQAAVPEPAYDPVFQPAPAPAAPEIGNPFGDQGQEQLVIPPAPGFGERTSRRPKERGFLKWLLLLLLLGLLAIAGYFGWTNKEALVAKLSAISLFDESGDDDAIKPTPVKTITIKPEPEAEAKPEEPAAPVAKVERRLTEDGEEIETSPKPVQITPELTQVTPATQPSGDSVPPIAQNAILYEEGSIPAENTVDAGRVVWSVVEESPSADEPKEPAIRARIEIPSRNVVLIMTIKRNTDKALPASHLIELIFAVPDDFSGGGVGQINRFVLKENEQGRGEALVAVPARIADGIFLIALNNLPEAKTQNETLLKTRDWIDIPMEYRTGRRALVTLEKGIPGDKVFEEVFAAWDARQ